MDQWYLDDKQAPDKGPGGAQQSGDQARSGPGKVQDVPHPPLHIDPLPPDGKKIRPLPSDQGRADGAPEEVRALLQVLQLMKGPRDSAYVCRQLNPWREPADLLAKM